MNEESGAWIGDLKSRLGDIQGQIRERDRSVELLGRAVDTLATGHQRDHDILIRLVTVGEALDARLTQIHALNVRALDRIEELERAAAAGAGLADRLAALEGTMEELQRDRWKVQGAWAVLAIVGSLAVKWLLKV